MVENKKVKKMEEKEEKMKDEKKLESQNKNIEKSKTENKEVKKDDSKNVPSKEKKIKKDLAVAKGVSLRISPKYACAICKVIRGKSPGEAVMRLQSVVDGKRAIPMAGLEVGHKKGKGLAGGKFPKNASKAIIGVIRQLGANAVVAEIESPIITIAKADRAPAPYRKGGRKGKRTHIYLEAKDKIKLIEKKNKLGDKK